MDQASASAVLFRFNRSLDNLTVVEVSTVAV